MLAIRVLGRPALAPVFVAVWCLVAVGINQLLWQVAERVFDSRRENFTMLA